MPGLGAPTPGTSITAVACGAVILLRAGLVAAGIPMVAMPASIGGGDLVILWIDAPTDAAAGRRAVDECARLKIAQARRDLADG